MVLEEHCVSNGDVWKLDERLVVDRLWELQEKSEGLERSNLANGSTGQSKDVGPTCKHVAALIGNVLEQVRSISFAGWFSCTNIDWLL